MSTSGMNRFKAAYGFHNMSTSGRSEQEKVIEAIDTFMIIFVLGEDIMNMTTPQIQQEREGILETYPTWNDTAAFVREAWQGQFGATSGRAGDYSFQDAQRVVEGIQDSYGRWQDKECRTMKRTLLNMEESGAGRAGPEALAGARRELHERPQQLPRVFGLLLRLLHQRVRGRAQRGGAPDRRANFRAGAAGEGHG